MEKKSQQGWKQPKELYKYEYKKGTPKIKKNKHKEKT